MIEWLSEILNSWNLTWTGVFLGLGFFTLTFLASITLMRFLLINLPADYLSASLAREAKPGRGVPTFGG